MHSHWVLWLMLSGHELSYDRSVLEDCDGVDGGSRRMLRRTHHDPSGRSSVWGTCQVSAAWRTIAFFVAQIDDKGARFMGA